MKEDPSSRPTDISANQPNTQTSSHIINNKRLTISVRRSSANNSNVTQKQNTDKQNSTPQQNIPQGRKPITVRQGSVLQGRVVPAIKHPNFDSAKNPPDPERPLTDIPEPFRRSATQIDGIYQQEDATDSNECNNKLSHNNPSDKITTSKDVHKQKNKQAQLAQKNTSKIKVIETDGSRIDNPSKWQLIQSSELAEHLDLLQAGGLIKLPKSFYHNTSKQPLLDSLEKMTLVDMGEIQQVLKSYPMLTRFGMQQPLKTKSNQSSQQKQIDNTVDVTDIHNRDNSAEWEVILYPQRFDDADGHNLATDITAVSIATHVLKQCPTRKSVNLNYTVTDIVQYVRSYVLSQCQALPKMRQQLTHTPIYSGHIIVAAHLLGWEVQSNDNGDDKASTHGSEVYVNISSRCGLLARYPVLAEYYVEGWE